MTCYQIRSRMKWICLTHKVSLKEDRAFARTRPCLLQTGRCINSFFTQICLSLMYGIKMSTLFECQWFSWMLKWHIYWSHSWQAVQCKANALNSTQEQITEFTPAVHHPCFSFFFFPKLDKSHCKISYHRSTCLHRGEHMQDKIFRSLLFRGQHWGHTGLFAFAERGDWIGGLNESLAHHVYRFH